MRIYFFAFGLLLILNSCQSQNCNKLPQRFTSYEQAISLVQRSTFNIYETANTSNSSWITSAKYYSCDGVTGFFIYSTNKGYYYIHCGVPVSIWNALKNASSKGSYYDRNIKHKYQLKLN